MPYGLVKVQTVSMGAVIWLVAISAFFFASMKVPSFFLKVSLAAICEHCRAGGGLMA
jgi:hypothetical protein